ncbi:hypothetical protein Q3G72_025366 [Acer saccharum]|nr:hypothetical protein Q3G72_025366 [Acer saccharum]
MPLPFFYPETKALGLLLASPGFRNRNKLFGLGKSRKAYECASRRRIPTQSAPTAREYQPVGVGSAPRALFALGVVQPSSYFVRSHPVKQSRTRGKDMELIGNRSQVAKA